MKRKNQTQNAKTLQHRKTEDADGTVYYKCWCAAFAILGRKTTVAPFDDVGVSATTRNDPPERAPGGFGWEEWGQWDEW